MKRVIKSENLLDKIKDNDLLRLVQKMENYFDDIGCLWKRIESERVYRGPKGEPGVRVLVDADDGTYLGAIEFLLETHELRHDDKFETLWDMNLDEFEEIKMLFEQSLSL